MSAALFSESEPVNAGHRLNRHYLNAYRTSLVEVIRCQLRQAKFNDGLQGVLELAESIDLTSTLLAADLQVQTPGPAAAVTATVSDALRSDELLV